MFGTLINAAAVIVGGAVGLLIHTRMPKKIVRICFQAIGLFTLFLGVNMAFKTSQFLILIFSVVVGSIIGEWIDLDRQLHRFSAWLKRKVKSNNDQFSEGFVTSFLLFCMGSMAILGAIEEGLGNAPNLLLAKSLLDGFSAIALAAAMGVGVLFSAVPLVLYQGGLTLFAAFVEPYLTETVINELTAVGGLLLIGLGINLLEIKTIKVTNMLPALLIAVVLASLFV